MALSKIKLFSCTSRYFPARFYLWLKLKFFNPKTQNETFLCRAQSLNVGPRGPTYANKSGARSDKRNEGTYTPLPYLKKLKIN